MGFSCGIVGLPNVGKSTLFNALTKQSVASSNYPFCTIDPNIGTVAVPDERMDKILEYVTTKKVVPTFMHFTDIAGLIKGASTGQGLGNKFLSHIRELEAIAHIVRLFKDKDVTSVGELNPIEDFEIVITELKLKDIEGIENRKKRLEKDVKVGHKEKKAELIFIDRIDKYLEEEDKLLFNIENLNKEERVWLKSYALLTTKPQIIVANLNEEQLANINNSADYAKLKDFAQSTHNIEVIPLCAKIEQEIAGALSEKETNEYLKSFGIKESSLNTLIKKGHELLDLLTFYTVGEKECRGWDISSGLSAPKAAAKIHNDFEKGFIRAEIISYNDFIENECSLQKVRESGKLRLEGKDYIMKDGDIVHFRFNV